MNNSDHYNSTLFMNTNGIFLKTIFRSTRFSAIIVFALLYTTAAAQSGKTGQFRMIPQEVIDLKASGPTAPGSSNVAGVQVIVIQGDPAKPGLYTIILKVEANTKIAAHLHPDDRIGTVISGTWHFGYGDKFDESALKKLPVGSIYSEVAGQNHFAMTGNEPVVVAISGNGPSGVTYVNPADEPKKEKN